MLWISDESKRGKFGSLQTGASSLAQGMRVGSPDAQSEERSLSEKGGSVHSCDTLNPKSPTLSAIPGCARPVDCGLRPIRCAIL